MSLEQRGLLKALSNPSLDDLVLLQAMAAILCILHQQRLPGPLMATLVVARTFS